MALLAFRGMGNVKACVELLLKWEMVVMSMKCCSGFAVCVWFLEVLGVHGRIALVLEKGSVYSVWQLSIMTVDSPHPVPLWWGVALEQTQAFIPLIREGRNCQLLFQQL